MDKIRLNPTVYLIRRRRRVLCFHVRLSAGHTSRIFSTGLGGVLMYILLVCLTLSGFGVVVPTCRRWIRRWIRVGGRGLRGLRVGIGV